MIAVAFDEFGTAPTLHDDLPSPEPSAGQVLIRVHASSVNPIDNAIATGMLKDMLPHEFPVVLGRDFAGVVEQIGEGVSAVAVGDEVFGLVPASTGGPIHDGAWAELAVSSEHTLTRRPDNVDTAIAGAAGLAAVTALQLIDALDLSANRTLLIVGATGGVGSLAVQLAAAAGTTIIAPGRPDDEAFLRNLGVSHVIPRDGDVIAAARDLHPEGVDAIIDNVSMGTIGTYDEALADRGRIASATNAAGEGPRRTNVMNMTSPEILGRISRHLADGTLTIPIQHTYDLAQAARALNDLTTEHTQGKLAIRIR